MHGAHAAKSKERSLTKEFGCEKFDGNYEPNVVNSISQNIEDKMKFFAELCSSYCWFGHNNVISGKLLNLSKW